MILITIYGLRQEERGSKADEARTEIKKAVASKTNILPAGITVDFPACGGYDNHADGVRAIINHEGSLSAHKKNQVRPAVLGVIEKAFVESEATQQEIAHRYPQNDGGSPLFSHKREHRVFFVELS